MKVSWLVALCVWVGLQVWYWMALRTVKVANSRAAQLSEAERESWRAWLRADRPYRRWWQPLLGATVIFPCRALILIALCLLQLVVVTACAPFRRCLDEHHGRALLTRQQAAWLGRLVRSVITALAWAQLRCLGVSRVEEYEVLNQDLMSIPLESAVDQIKTRKLERVECNVLDEPRNYVSNHVSYVDIVLYIALLYPSFCSKATVAALPMIGDTAKWLDCIFIIRDSQTDCRRALDLIQARQTRVWQAAACFRNLGNDQLIRLVDFRKSLPAVESDRAAISPASTRLPTEQEASPSAGAFDEDVSFESTPSLMVFPEGTTSNGRYLLPFKRGAFAALKPVSPIVLVYDCPWYQMSYEIIPIVWLYPVLAGCYQGTTVKIYWIREICPTVQMVITRAVGAYTQAVRDAMTKVLLAVTGQEPRPHWTGDLESKRACIHRLFH